MFIKEEDVQMVCVLNLIKARPEIEYDSKCRAFSKHLKASMLTMVQPVALLEKFKRLPVP